MVKMLEYLVEFEPDILRSIFLLSVPTGDPDYFKYEFFFKGNHIIFNCGLYNKKMVLTIDEKLNVQRWNQLTNIDNQMEIYGLLLTQKEKYERTISGSITIDDKTLLSIYLKGFSDELKGVKQCDYKHTLSIRAYTLGQIHAITGDDIRSVDGLTEEEIIKKIKE